MKNLIFVFVLALLINNNLVGQTIYKSRYEYRDSLGKMVYKPNNILFIFDSEWDFNEKKFKKNGEVKLIMKNLVTNQTTELYLSQAIGFSNNFTTFYLDGLEKYNQIDIKVINAEKPIIADIQFYGNTNLIGFGK